MVAFPSLPCHLPHISISFVTAILQVKESDTSLLHSAAPSSVSKLKISLSSKI
jgi:hypothetical protein